VNPCQSESWRDKTRLPSTWCGKKRKIGTTKHRRVTGNTQVLAGKKEKNKLAMLQKTTKIRESRKQRKTGGGRTNQSSNTMREQTGTTAKTR